MGAAFGPEAMRTVQKVLFINGSQHLPHRVLDQFVLERGNANRPSLTLALGDVDASDGLMAVLLALQPRVQILEVRLQVLPVLRLCDPIHAHRRRTALAMVGPFQGRHVNQMRKGVKPSLGFAFRSVHYLPKSW
jgi:hypothetical protein